MGTSEVLAFDDSLIIRGKSFFYLFKSERVIPYSDIKRIFLQKSKFNFLNILHNIPGTNQEAGVNIVFKQKNQKNLLISGSDWHSLKGFNDFLQTKV